MKRLFEITGDDQALKIHATVEQAIGPTASGDAVSVPRPATFQAAATGGYA